MRACIRTPFFLLALFAYDMTAAQAAGEQQRAIDAAASAARFSVSHIWVEQVSGTIPILRGTITLPHDSLIPLAVTAVLDPARVSSGEPDRDAALKSPDFFDTARFPAWTFESTKIVRTSNTAFELDGNLTIHGVTQLERLNVTIAGDAAHPIYHASGHIDRHAFGMATTRLDPVIGNPVDITLDVTVTR